MEKGTKTGILLIGALAGLYLISQGNAGGAEGEGGIGEKVGRILGSPGTLLSGIGLTAEGMQTASQPTPTPTATKKEISTVQQRAESGYYDVFYPGKDVSTKIKLLRVLETESISEELHKAGKTPSSGYAVAEQRVRESERRERTGDPFPGQTKKEAHITSSGNGNGNGAGKTPSSGYAAALARAGGN